MPGLKKSITKKTQKRNEKTKKKMTSKTKNCLRKKRKRNESMKSDKRRCREKRLLKKEDKKEIDVKEHVDALIAGEDSLSEEFKTKAATVFETAIKSKVKEIAEEMQADFDKKIKRRNF